MRSVRDGKLGYDWHWRGLRPDRHVHRGRLEDAMSAHRSPSLAFAQFCSFPARMAWSLHTTPKQSDQIWTGLLAGIATAKACLTA